MEYLIATLCIVAVILSIFTDLKLVKKTTLASDPIQSTKKPTQDALEGLGFISEYSNPATQFFTKSHFGDTITAAVNLENESFRVEIESKTTPVSKEFEAFDELILFLTDLLDKNESPEDVLEKFGFNSDDRFPVHKSYTKNHYNDQLTVYFNANESNPSLTLTIDSPNEKTVYEKFSTTEDLNKFLTDLLN